MLRMNSKFRTSFYILLGWFWGVCYGFVLLSLPAGAGRVPGSHVLEPGSWWLYEIRSSVLLNEKEGTSVKNVGFFVDGEVLVQSLWGGNYERVLRIELKSPKLNIRSRKAPAPEGFINHGSKLESLNNKPCFVHWNKGRIEKILLAKNEDLSIANIKKGIASLFQFQFIDETVNETDASGHCEATYTSTGPTTFQKTKELCTSPDLPYFTNLDKILSAKVDSQRLVEYEMDKENKFFEKIEATETHQIYLAVNEEAGNVVEARQTLTLKGASKGEILNSESAQDALNQILNKENVQFTQESLVTEKEWPAEDKNQLANAVKDTREFLKPSSLGTQSSAKSLVQVVLAARRSNKEEIGKVLGSKKNQPILHQLYDIMGYVQTVDAHEAVMKKLHLEKKTNEEYSERYLWALSISPRPNPDIINDLLKRYRKLLEIPEKVKETLVLTLASMAYRFQKLPFAPNKRKVLNAVEEAITNGLNAAKGEERYAYLRAFKNLKSQTTIPTLLDVVQKGTPKEGVLAWRAIRAQDPQQWTRAVTETASKTFFQLDRKHDSSSRTLALEVILESNPSREALTSIAYHLISNDPAFEIKQYILQMIQMLAEKKHDLACAFYEIITSDGRLNNYHVLAQKGLSIALKRSFLRSPSSNGSLLTVQEMYGGIVKRGIVNVVMEKEDVSKEIFSLGIFSGGLNSFMSSTDSENEMEDDTATAGMELTVLGTQMRPFTFFSGQGELMGHVWSGTASERTTAYQALAMLQDHLQYLRLGSGFIAELDVQGAASFDLAGNIEISLWNRYAKSLVEKAAGIFVVSGIRVDTSFVHSRVEFRITIEPILNLNTDIDFSGNANLCMRLTQPDLTFRHSVFKIERIPGSKHRLRIAKYRKSVIPGRTYSLNAKNDIICSEMFT